MEAKLENILDNMMSNENVVGAVVADNQGLCFASEFWVISSLLTNFINFLISARGKASADASGLITAIADQASKLHPNSNAPVVILESSDRFEGFSINF